MQRMRYILFLFCIQYGRTATPDKRDLGESIASSAGASLSGIIGGDSIASTAIGGVGASNIPIQHTVSEYHTRVAVPYPQPVPISVPRPVPYPVHVGVPVDSPRPVPVPVPHPVAHIIPRPYAVPIDRPFPYPVPQPVPVTVTQGIGIPVPQPYAVSVPSAVPVRVPIGVPVSLGGYGGYGGAYGGVGGSGLFSSRGYASSVGSGSGFVSSEAVSHHHPVASNTAVVSSHGHEIEHEHHY